MPPPGSRTPFRSWEEVAKEQREPWQAIVKVPRGMGASRAAGGKSGRSWHLPDAEEKQEFPCGGRLLPPPGDQRGTGKAAGHDVTLEKKH